MYRNILFSAVLFFFMLLSACQQGVNASQNQSQSQSQPAPVFANETDFICGMQVQADFTDTCQYKGKTYAFCSESCKEEFLAAPETFLNKADNQ